MSGSSVVWRLEGAALDGRGRARLAPLSLELGSGATALIGASGAGKTSLVELLVGHARPSRGHVRFSAPAGDFGLPRFWQPQEGGLWPGVPVVEHLRLVGGREGAAELLEELGLSSVADEPPERLSRGQRGRLSLARALASRAAALVLDEPLAHVGDEARRAGWAAIRRRRASGALVFATHDPALVLAEAPRVVALEAGAAGGELRWAGATAELYARPPSAELGRLLGPLNWFGQAAPWLPATVHPCVRPEALAVVADDGGPLRVTSARFGGAWCETQLTVVDGDASLTVVHRPPVPPTGRVRLALQQPASE